MLRFDDISNIKLGDFRPIDGSNIEFASFINGDVRQPLKMVLPTSNLDVKSGLKGEYGTIRIPLENDRLSIVSELESHIAESNELQFSTKLTAIDKRGEKFMRAKLPRDSLAANGFGCPNTYKLSGMTGDAVMFEPVQDPEFIKSNVTKNSILCLVEFTGVWRNVDKEADVTLCGISARVKNLYYPNGDVHLDEYEKLVSKNIAKFNPFGESHSMTAGNATGKSQPKTVKREKTKAARHNPISA